MALARIIRFCETQKQIIHNSGVILQGLYSPPILPEISFGCSRIVYYSHRRRVATSLTRGVKLTDWYELSAPWMSMLCPNEVSLAASLRVRASS